MIRPSWWTDADLHTRLTADVREFYIGLWQLADDAGYVSWDINRIGAELYPYRPHAERVALIGEWIELLGADHARLLECGRHVLVPNLSKYQAPPKPSFQNRRAHEDCVRQMAPRGATGDQMAPAQEGGLVGEGKEGVLKGGAAAPKDQTGDTEFRRLVPLHVALGGRG